MECQGMLDQLAEGQLAEIAEALESGFAARLEETDEARERARERIGYTGPGSE